jgi:general L-amino acid transport system substrate-binding protein
MFATTTTARSAFRHWLPALCAAATLTAAGLAQAQGQGATVEAIMKRGELLCSGANENSPGFAVVDNQGAWSGFDIDFCRAIAVAVLGDVKKLKLVPVSFVQRFPALQSGDIDVIVKNTSWTLTRNTELGLQFSAPYFFTGIGIMVYKNLGVSKGTDLSGATVCTTAGTTLEKAAADFFTKHKRPYTLLTFEKPSERNEAYLAKRCDAIVNGFPQLAAIRAFSAANADDHVILPDLLDNEIYGALVRQGDEKFLNIVTWTIFATIQAEELGITQANVDEKLKDPNPKIARLLGATPGIGKKLGLRETWAYDVLKTVGNYGEIYDRNLGSKSKMNLPRASNKLWVDGGLLYSPQTN